MQKKIAKDLIIKARQVGVNFSRKDREGNVNGEEFALKTCYALSDHTALVTYNKTTTKDALAFFFYVDGYWEYFFPTDKHMAGFRYFENIKINHTSWNIVPTCSDVDNLNSQIQKVIVKYPTLNFDSSVYMTSDTAVVRFKNKENNIYLGFFYYINKGRSKGWRWFFPSESHLNGFMIFQLEKFNVEKENYDKNFIELNE